MIGITLLASGTFPGHLAAENPFADTLSTGFAGGHDQSIAFKEKHVD
jgi:hypothetical protein